jgi:hypothetical protein
MNGLEERRALWIYPWDILDGGIDEVVDRAAGELGLSALSLCASYHSAKFLLPKRRTEKVFLSGGSAIYFRPDEAAYAETSLRPVVTPRAELLGVLDRTAEACRARGIGLRAWTVGLHNSRLGEAHPEAVERNVFGDPYPWALCPANPDVRCYLVALVRDLAVNHDLDAIDLESVGYHGFTHGHHHELVGVTFGPVEEFLMGLCFCPACLGRAGEVGVDGAGVRAGVRDLLEARFTDEAAMPAADPADAGGVASLLAGWSELAAFVRMRLDTVTSLVQELKTEALAGSATRLALTAATFQRGADNAWLEGMDLRALGRTADEVILLGYFHDPAKVAAEVRTGLEMVGDPERLVLGLSLLAPATSSGANLAAKVGEARALGTTKFSFYNYGFVSDARLAWLGSL